MINRRNLIASGLLAVTMLCLACHQTIAWIAKGHEEAAEHGTALAAAELPEFFKSGVATIRHCSQDPDVFKIKEMHQLDSAEYPEHFIDLELLGDAKLPATRYEFIDLCYARKLRPDKVGLLPYAVAEWTQRLTVAFAEYRKWPQDQAVQQKCLVYAGILSHYAADLCMSLHTTVDYDGRVKEGANSPRTGIHVKVDALIEKVSLTKEELKAVHAAALTDLMAGIMAELNASHALVDKVYKLELDLPALNQPLPASGPVADFARERLIESARFTASLYLTAWENSAKVNFPAHHHRPADMSTSKPSASPATMPAYSFP